MHVEMDDDLTLYAAHVISDEVEQSIIAMLGDVDVIIHEDPQSLDVKRFTS